MVHFTQCGLARLFHSPAQCRDRSLRVTPFGHPQINGYVPLPAAFRGLSRPSSPGGSTGIRRGPMLAWPYPSSRHIGWIKGYGCHIILHHGALQCAPCSSASLLFPVKEPPGIGPDCHVVLVENRGLEPLTLGLQSRCSSQLS